MNANDISPFLSRKSGGGEKYNYDLSPLINDFSFLDFVHEGLKYREVGNDFGAFLVITDKQYVLGYNAGFGVGTHVASFARTFIDLKGGGRIANDLEALRIAKKCNNEYITARIMYECVGEDEFRNPIYAGSISFTLETLPISKGQFDVFKKFYEDYNKEIELVVKKCSINNFCVWYSYKDENKELCIDQASNLDNLYNFLEKNVDYNKTIIQEEVLFGIEPNGVKLTN